MIAQQTNHAKLANQAARANERDARHVQLDAQGNPTNTDPNGNPWHYATLMAAQESQSQQVYFAAMQFLDEAIGGDDTRIVKCFDRAKGKFANAAHAEEMKIKLMTAALNGSKAGLISYAAACIYLNQYTHVDFGWFVNGSDELTKPVTAEDGYLIQTTVETTSTPAIGFTISLDEADCEGFVPTIRVATISGLPFVVGAPAPAKPDPRPAVPAVVATPQPAAEPATEAMEATPAQPAAEPTEAPTSATPAPVSTITTADGRVLTATATGWLAESASSPGTFHDVASDGSTCSCPGYTHHDKCWHVEAVRSQVEDSPQKAEAGPYPRTATHNGIFTVNGLSNGHRTFKIKRQKEKSSFMPDRRVAYLLTGPDPDDYASWTSFGVFDEDGEIRLWKSKRDHGKWIVLANVLSHPEDHEDLTWNSEESCCFCNRTLTTPESASRGYGPVCAENRGLPYGAEEKQPDEDECILDLID